MQNKDKKYIPKEKAKDVNNLRLQKTDWEKWMENMENRMFYHYKTEYDYK